NGRRDPSIKLERVNKIEDGANANVSRLEMSVHSSTHVDAPLHFIPGAPSVDMLPLNVLIGPAQVVEIAPNVDVLTEAVLRQAGIAPAMDRVLFKTRNSEYWRSISNVFQTDFVGIDEGGSKYLAERGIRLVGIDYLSVAPYKMSRPTHLVMLGAGMVVIEGLNLLDVPAGYYRLVCLPAKLKGSDGAPARVVLLDE
ncbi:MAG: cyclase family protein, partial [Anaerolineaceae bacterium]|nr:cyclase family protein [Anaerolineaceae bacterium]